METIKNYLESMFRGLPLTDKVVKAKSELLQMMEDKYSELIRSGKTENEAVGEVIQNFGNLEDLAEDLGIMDILYNTKYSEVKRRKVSFEEMTEFLAAKKQSLLLRCTGIFMCIICVAFPIIIDAFEMNDIAGATLMFISVAVGVVLMCLSKAVVEQWRYLKHEPCSIDAVSIDYLKNKVRDFTPTYSVLSSLGVLLCVLCFIPPMVLDEIGGHITSEFGAAFLFVFVGAGVFMIVFAKKMKRTYLHLLNINETVDFTEPKYSPEKIQNPVARTVMSVYWPVILCLYFCISFATFQWHMTWLIWPIAGVGFSILRSIFAVKNEKTKENAKENKKEE